mmetsp:Transcript_3493/g.4713  ORF Transcript_3493/g.4713 Transcript_3493/m.4713 type:complete len:630 (+) Transcript_3493:216-2105(+)
MQQEPDTEGLLLLSSLLTRLPPPHLSPLLLSCSALPLLFRLLHSFQVIEKKEGRDGGPLRLECRRSGALVQLLSHLLASCSLRRALLVDPVAVPLLFSLLCQDNFRSFAMSQIILLLKLELGDEASEVAGRQAVLMQYLECLSAVRDQWWPEAGAPTLTALLAGIRELLRWSPALMQELLTQLQAHVQIVSVLNWEYPGSFAVEIVTDVVETLDLLLAGSGPSKETFRVQVGYDTLLRAVLQLVPSPPRMVLLALLHITQDAGPNSPVPAPIQNWEAVEMFFRGLWSASEELQASGLDTFLGIVKDSVASKVACQRAGLLSLLLDAFLHTPHTSIRPRLATLIQVCGAYSMTGSELRRMVGLLGLLGAEESEPIQQQHQMKEEEVEEDSAAATGQLSGSASGSTVGRPCQGLEAALLLLRCLRETPAHQGPASFFHFDRNSAGIHINNFLRWSASRGYSLVTWLRVETFPDELTCHSEPGVAEMVLLNACLPDGRGLCISIALSKVCFEVSEQAGPRGAAISRAEVPVALPRRRWCHLAITHTAARTAFSQSVCFWTGARLGGAGCGSLSACRTAFSPMSSWLPPRPSAPRSHLWPLYTASLEASHSIKMPFLLVKSCGCTGRVQAVVS